MKPEKLEAEREKKFGMLEESARGRKKLSRSRERRSLAIKSFCKHGKDVAELQKVAVKSEKDFVELKKYGEK